MAKEKKPRHEALPFDPEHSAFAVPHGTRIIALSDLHIGVYGRKKLGESLTGIKDNAYTDNEVVEMVKQSIRQADKDGHVVLNGDIFEHMMHKYKGKAEARDDFNKTMEEWIAVAEEVGAQLHYVGGNHDDGKKLIAAMQEQESAHPANFHYHPVALRLGHTLFVHGDLPLRSGKNGVNAGERIPSNEKFITHRVHGLLFGENQTPDPDDDSWHSNLIHSMESRLNISGIQREIQRHEDKNFPPHIIAAHIWQALLEAAHDCPEMLHAFEKKDGSTVPAVTQVSTGHTHIAFTNITLDPKLAVEWEFGREALHVKFDGTGTALEPERLNILQYTEQARGMKVEELHATVDAHHSVTLTSHSPQQWRSR